MPSFSSIGPTSQLGDGHSEASVDSASGSAASRPRMIHWSHIKGPLTEGFRKQREKHAASAVEPPIPQPLRSSQTDYGKDEMEAHMPAHFTAVAPLQNMASCGDTAMTPYELEQRSGVPARQQTTVPFRRVDTATYTRLALGHQDYNNSLNSDGNYDWKGPRAPNDLVTLREVFPVTQQYRSAQSGANYSNPPQEMRPTQNVLPLIGTLTPVPWPADPLHFDVSQGYGHHITQNPSHTRKRKRSYEQERAQSVSPPRKSRQRARSSPKGKQLRKRNRSKSFGLKREKSTSFHEQYVESARKGGKLPTDIDCFGYDEDDDEDLENWSTFERLKKQQKVLNGTAPADAETVADDIPSIYTTFQPRFKPKVDRKDMITITNAFKLPVPALDKISSKSNIRQPVVTVLTDSTGLTRRPLFQPPPASGSSRVVEIPDDEERKKQKAEALKGLSSAGLGLSERQKQACRDDQAPSKQSGGHKSSLYTTSKLGNDMEATSSVPFAKLEQFRYEEEEEWTSSPEGSPAPDARPLAGCSATDHTATESASRQNEAPQPVLPPAKKWTFKMFGRG